MRSGLWIVTYWLALAILVLLLPGCGPSRVELDNEQGRLDEAAPLIESATTVGQTFVSHRDRLTAVEVLLVVYGETGAPAGELTFHLRADPNDRRDLVTKTFRTGELVHNQPLRVSFDPLPGSLGGSYYFFFEGTAGSRVTVWYNTIDAYGEGTAVFDGQPWSGDLQFKTFYDYSVGLIAADALRGVTSRGWLLLPLAALLLLPGYLALVWGVPADELPDPMLQLALAIGLSVAILPLGLLLITLVGLSVTPLPFGGLLGLAGLATVWRVWKLNWRPLAGWRDRSNWPVLAVFLSVLAVTLALRMLQIRGLVVPAWVDGLHHTMMAQLIAEQGGVPADYTPYLDIGPFIYHFGFHAVAAGLAWLTGLTVPQAVLLVGQVLNALVGVGVYGLTVVMIGEHKRSSAIAGLVAMGLVGTVSLMPAYYVTWGRYTQLAGLVVLPVALMLTVKWVEAGRRWALALASITVAGLGLVHYRVLVFYAAFVVAWLVYRVVSRAFSEFRYRTVEEHSTSNLEPFDWAQDRPRTSDYFLRVAVLAAGSLLMLAPWIFRLWVALVPTGRGAAWFRGQPSFNAVPYSLIDVGYDRLLLRLALLSLLLGLVWWRRVSIVFGLWIAGVVLAANPNSVGGQETWLLSNTVLAITLFLPMSALTGVMAGTATDAMLAQVAGRWRAALAAALTGVFLVGVLVGAWNMLDVVNPVTVIATEDDIMAMQWIRENTEPGAGFMINTRIWQMRTYMGADGGYWIPLLTGRRTLVPPVIYSFGSRPSRVRIQELLDSMAGISEAGDPTLKQVMSEHNLEYIYLGAKGGQLDLKSFLADPAYSVAYSNGSVWIFRATGTGAGASKQ